MERENQQNNQLQNMSFSESWKQPAVQVGLAGTVIGGSLFMMGKGDPVKLYNSFKKSGKKTLDRIDKYIDKQIGPIARLIKNVGKKAAPGIFRKINEKNHPLFRPGEHEQYIINQIRNFKPKKINSDARMKMFLEQDNLPPGTPPEYFFNKVLREKINEKLPTTKERNEILQEKKEKKFDWKATATEAATASVIGSAFALGISGWHAVDQKINPSNAAKNKEKAFEVAGSSLAQQNKPGAQSNSFRPNNQRRNDNQRRNNNQNRQNFNFQNKNRYNYKQNSGGSESMKKNASIESLRYLYEGATDLSKRPVQALATGLGFTGISLGSAAFLKQNPSLIPGMGAASSSKGEDEKKSSSPRIIIELGKENSTNPSEMGMGMGLLPKSADDQGPTFLKVANQTFLGTLQNYFKNLGGRHSEISKLDDRIKNFRYKTQAVDEIDKQPLDVALNQNFNNLNNDPDMKKSLYEELIERKADELKGKDMADRQAIKDQVIKARLGTAAVGAGVGSAGLGLAYLAHRKNNTPEEV